MVPAPSPALEVQPDMRAFRLLSECPLPTEAGDSMLRIYGDGTCSPWPVCVYGEVHGRSGVTMRLHDACLTSEVLGSVKCDCALQLKLAQRQIAASSGVLIYSPQEGRGIGLANKISAYALQAREGLDTVDANLALGLPDENRNYQAVPFILRDLGVSSVRLLTNNPYKINSLRALGVEVEGEECQVCDDELSAYSRFYLSTKAKRMDHMVSTARDVPNPILQQAAGKPAPNQQSNGKHSDAETPAKEAEPAPPSVAASKPPPQSWYQLWSQLWSPVASLAAAVRLI